jgi:hypothetical protein
MSRGELSTANGEERDRSKHIAPAEASMTGINELEHRAREFDRLGAPQTRAEYSGTRR